MSTRNTKEYLGDSVYVDCDRNGDIVLTTENGWGPNNTIVLERSVWNALLNYVERMEENNERKL